MYVEIFQTLRMRISKNVPVLTLCTTQRYLFYCITPGILMVTSSLGMVLLPGLTGWLMTSLSPSSFRIVILTAICLNIAIFLLMCCLASQSNKRAEDGTEERNGVKFSDDNNNNYLKETTQSTRLSGLSEVR